MDINIFTYLFEGESLLERGNRQLIIFMVIVAMYIIDKILEFISKHIKK